MTTARAIVDDVLSRAMTRKIWTGNYEEALPLSVQDFDLGAVLPAVFYMFRFGRRRGQGKFLDTFGAGGSTPKEKKRLATIDRVAEHLAQTRWFSGFDGPTERAILGDLLLCYCLENRNRALGRTEQIQRVAPAHYMASWIDLPESVAWLRFVPEAIVALLADQSGSVVELTKEGERSWFAVGCGFEDNVLLKAFHQGVVLHGDYAADERSDRFQEEIEVGLDQLLMIRLAQCLGQAPERLRGAGGERISNQRPIAAQPTRYFSEDIRHFVRAYSGVIPRHAFVELLESCMGVGLTTIVTSVIELLFEWADSGMVREKCNQRPPELFVDASQGVDRNLRGLAEQSLSDFLRRVERFPVILMALRILDYEVRHDPQLRRVNLPTRPYATEWLSLLGEVLHARRDEAKSIFDDLERKSSQLREGLKSDFSEAAEILEDERQVQPNVVWRLAEAITLLQGRANIQKNLLQMIDSALFLDRPNGLAAKRRVSRQTGIGGNKKASDIRRLVFTDSVLDYLVHVHVLHGNKSGYRARSFRRFLQILRERYGFCVDVAPTGMTISNELLEANRSILERRLRDLGLWVGVNDAEAMKRLRPRFGQTEYEHDLD
jgi:hypothetical protein